MTIGFLGTAAEAGVYSYIGIAVYALIPGFWSFSFVFIQFFIIVVFRVFSVFAVFYTGRLCCKKRTINFRELTFISYAGMIRGAIAFALVLTLPNTSQGTCTVTGQAAVDQCFSNQIYSMLVSTTLMTVMLTTLLFGTFMPKVQKILCPPTIEDKEEFARSQRAISTISQVLRQSMAKQPRPSIKSESEYEQIVHPNEEPEVEEIRRKMSYLLPEAPEPGSWADSRFVNWFALFDEEKLRPFFIRNYNVATAIMEDQYQELIQNKFDDQDDEEVFERIEEVRRTVSQIKDIERSRSVMYQGPEFAVQNFGKARTVSAFNVPKVSGNNSLKSSLAETSIVQVDDDDDEVSEHKKILANRKSASF